MAQPETLMLVLVLVLVANVTSVCVCVCPQAGDDPTPHSLSMEDDCRPLLSVEHLGESSSNRGSADSLDGRLKRCV